MQDAIYISLAKKRVIVSKKQRQSMLRHVSRSVLHEKGCANPPGALESPGRQEVQVFMRSSDTILTFVFPDGTAEPPALVLAIFVT